MAVTSIAVVSVHATKHPIASDSMPKMIDEFQASYGPLKTIKL